MEQASKLGHMKIVAEPHVQRLIEAWERVEDDTPTEDFAELSGHLDLATPHDIENIVAIDGSFVTAPNVVHTHKQLAFLSVGAIVLQRSQLEKLRAESIIDPRELGQALREQSHVHSAVLPLSGVVMPGETLLDTLRKTIDDVLRYTGLYEVLKFLVFRSWDPNYPMVEHMGCVGCGTVINIVKDVVNYQCLGCNRPHTLADWLALADAPPVDWASEESVIGFGNVLEALYLMYFVMAYRDRPTVLKRTLFVKDGPLLLRAQLSRLVEPIREFLSYLVFTCGRELHIVGVEKTGELVNHTALIEKQIPNLGDYFLPSVRYLHERIHGVAFDPRTYRNRVQYGSKVVVRLGPAHVVALNVPTGPFKTDPILADLYGFPKSASLLAELLSYSFENALVPLVLANSAVSISFNPSREVLEVFAGRLLGSRSP